MKLGQLSCSHEMGPCASPCRFITPRLVSPSTSRKTSTVVHYQQLFMMHPSDVFGGIIRALSYSNFVSFRGIVICLAVMVGALLYGYAFIPLKHVPGPWLSRIFPLQDRQGRRLRGRQLMHLHQRYGNPHTPPDSPL